jgi:hypothetical protein
MRTYHRLRAIAKLVIVAAFRGAHPSSLAWRFARRMIVLGGLVDA